MAAAVPSGWLGGQFAEDDFAPQEDLDVFAAEADLALHWGGFSAQSEFFFGRAEGSESDHRLYGRGLYAQAGFFLVPKRLEAAVRYSWVDPNRGRGDDRRTQYQVAANLFGAGHRLKAQADVTWLTEEYERLDDRRDTQYRLQLQAAF